MADGPGRTVADTAVLMSCAIVLFRSAVGQRVDWPDLRRHSPETPGCTRIDSVSGDTQPATSTGSAASLSQSASSVCNSRAVSRDPTSAATSTVCPATDSALRRATVVGEEEQDASAVHRVGFSGDEAAVDEGGRRGGQRRLAQQHMFVELAGATGPSHFARV